MDFTADAELTALLREWEAPPPSHDARARLLADFRAGVAPVPLWRRALTSQIRVPLPVAACAALALVLTPLAFGARAWTKSTPRTAGAEAAPAVRVVEVPVVRERVVTRTVYVEKRERGRGRGVLSQADERESLASEPTGPTAVRRADAGTQAASPGAGADASAGAFTRVNMEDFQPADEVKFRILKRGSVDEK